MLAGGGALAFALASAASFAALARASSISYSYVWGENDSDDEMFGRSNIFNLTRRQLSEPPRDHLAFLGWITWSAYGMRARC